MVVSVASMFAVDLALICVFAVVYGWGFYNLPILAAGVRSLGRSRQVQRGEVAGAGFLPSFSVVLPVRDEGKVVGRFLDSLCSLRYPADKLEIVIVEGGSTDGTLDVCRRFAGRRGNVKVLQEAVSSGKSPAVNLGIAHCSGEIVAMFDADSVPDGDAFLRAASYFADPSVAAVQGRMLSINSRENVWTAFMSYEEAVWWDAYLRGKDALRLFVHLRGSCQFIRRDVLERLSGLDEGFLADDMEISARLTDSGHTIRYASDVRAWQETPAKVKTFFKQRIRWVRGTMEVAFKYGRCMRHLSKKNFDVEATLLAPFILMASLLGYLAAFEVFFVSFPFNVVFASLSIVSGSLTVLVVGFALVYLSKPKRVKNLVWLPFVFGYWCILGFIALYAGLLILLRRPKRYDKTEKSGLTTESVGSTESGLLLPPLVAA